MSVERLVGGSRCGEVLEQLAEDVDGELAPEARLRIESHLRGCDVCKMIDRIPVACALAVLQLPTALAQNFEHDLRPPQHEDWREAGNAVDIDGDWAIVSGKPVSPQSGSSVGDDLPAMFRFDSMRGEWVFAQALVYPAIAGFFFVSEHAAVDAPHALLGSVRPALPRRVAQPWLLDAATGIWSSLPPITSPVAGEIRFGEVLDVDGNTALIADSGYQDRGVVHRFEFDTISQQWSFAETWTAPNGLGAFGFGFGLDLDLDGDTGAVFDLEDNVSLSSRVHIYEKGTGGWTLLQTITGGQGSTGPSPDYSRAPYEPSPGRTCWRPSHLKGNNPTCAALDALRAPKAPTGTTRKRLVGRS